MYVYIYIVCVCVYVCVCVCVLRTESELHRSLFLNDKFFWYPKGSLLPTDSTQYRIARELLEQVFFFFC